MTTSQAELTRHDAQQLRDELYEHYRRWQQAERAAAEAKAAFWDLVPQLGMDGDHDPATANPLAVLGVAGYRAFEKELFPADRIGDGQR